MGVDGRRWGGSAPPPPLSRFTGGAGNISVTAWIIIVCTAIFMIDGFLPTRWVAMEVAVAPGVTPASIDGKQVDVLQRQDLTRLRPGARGQVIAQPPVGTTSLAPILLHGTTQVVGEVHYQRMPFLNGWLYFSTARALIVDQPFFGWAGREFWRFIGFQFVHADLNHVLFNMLSLFFFGGVIESYLGKKRYLAFYLLCGICGALLYLALNLGGWAVVLFGGKPIPGLLFNDPYTPLIGASAGIFGIMFAAARLAPNTQVLLLFFIPMRLRTLAFLLAGYAIYTVVRAGDNAGGEAAHIGGAIAGWYFIKNTHHLHGFFDFLGRADPTSRSAVARRAARVAPDNAEIDRILAKIQSHGIGSITKAERDVLSRASRER